MDKPGKLYGNKENFQGKYIPVVVENGLMGELSIRQIVYTNKFLFFILPGFYQCLQCRRTYRLKASLQRHLTYECGQEPKFRCHLCEYACHLRSNLKPHILRKHKIIVP